MLLARERLNLHSGVLHLHKRRACQEAPSRSLDLHTRVHGVRVLLRSLPAAYRALNSHRRRYLRRESLLRRKATESRLQSDCSAHRTSERRTVEHAAHECLRRHGGVLQLSKVAVCHVAAESGLDLSDLAQSVREHRLGLPATSSGLDLDRRCTLLLECARGMLLARERLNLHSGVLHLRK